MTERPTAPTLDSPEIGTDHQERTIRLILRGPRGARLTRRELEILLLLAKGYGAAGIASQLGLRPRTVSGYVSVIYSKLGTQGRSGAILYAARAGLLDDATGDAPLKTG